MMDIDLTFVPKNPLPTEIQNMTRDDTICRFCGVSYLIHNEIKALQDKMEVMERELIHLREGETREATLKYEINEKNNVIGSFNVELKQKNYVIDSLNVEIKENKNRIDYLQIEIRRENERYMDLEKELEDSTKATSINSKESQFYKEKHRTLYSSLPHILKEIKQLRDSILTVKHPIDEFRNDFINLGKAITVNSQTLIEKATEGKIQLEDNLAHHQLEISDYAKEIENLKAESKSEENIIDKLNMKIKETEEDKTLNMNKIKELELMMNSLKTSSNKMKQEKELAEDNLRIREHELEEALQQQTNIEMSCERKIARFQGQLNSSYEKVQILEKSLHEFKIKIDQITNKNKMLLQDNSSMKKSLLQCQEHLVDVETELMENKEELHRSFENHHVQMEELRDSFKSKVDLADDYQKKLDEALQIQRHKYKSELIGIEERLKHDFTMELDIEKEKHINLLDRNISEMKNTIEELECEKQNLESFYQIEIENHKNLVDSEKNEHTKMKNLHQQEVNSLKKVIKELQKQFEKYNHERDQSNSDLKLQLSEQEIDLKSKNEEINSQKRKLSECDDEIKLLQETVRKEVEERFELTDALSIMKEELMMLKKFNGKLDTRKKLSSENLKIISPRSSTPNSMSQKIILAPLSQATSKAKQSLSRELTSYLD